MNDYGKVAMMLLSLAAWVHLGMSCAERQKQQHSLENYTDLIAEIILEREAGMSAEDIAKLRTYPEYCDTSLDLLEAHEPTWPNPETHPEVRYTLNHLRKYCQQDSG